MGIEYLPTDLPRYVKTTARTALANSVVADGHVLLFSEDGETLTAKKPDGSFAEIGGGGGGVEFYKCTEVVTPVAGIPQGVTLQMQGQDITLGTAKGITFTQEDATKKGRERTWISSDGAYRLINKEDEDQASGEHIWYIISAANTSYNVWTSINCTGSTSVNPWDLTEMVSNADGMSYALTWTVSEGTEGTPATWNGYKATMSDEGGYVFADTATTGLSFSKVKPVVGGVYTGDALVKILDMYTGMPVDGLVLYAPLDADNGIANTGQTLAKSDSSKVSYTTYKGIACVKLNGTYITAETGTVSVSPMTVSIWAAPLVEGKALWCSGSNGNPMMYYSSGNDFRLYSPDTAMGHGAIGDWHHCVWSINNNHNSTYYFDGVATGTVTTYESGTMHNVRIGYRNSDQPAWNGYLAGFRIYDRVLSAAEVAALYAEYIPAE